MMAHGKPIFKMVRVLKNGPMVLHTLETTSKERKKVQASIPGKTDLRTMDSGMTTLLKEKEPINGLMAENL